MTTSLESARAHERRVAEITAAVRKRARQGGAGYASLSKQAVSHFVPDPHDPRHKDRKIDVKALRHVLDVDVAAKRCVAEPGVTFADLLDVTLPHGLMPKLVPELKTITIGGAVAGCSVESLSYKFGGFHDSCLGYEVVTGTGDVVECSRSEDAELFEMIHGSYGTLGILTKLEFELVEAKPFVRMRYETLPSYAAWRARVRDVIASGEADFIDGIAHGPMKWVLCLGTMVDRAHSTSDYTWLDIYYKSTLERSEDTLTLRDYLFRYDTECHWLTRTLPGLESKPVRFALGKVLLGSTNLITWSNRLRPVLKHKKHPEVVVDVFIPDSRTEEFARWYEEKIRFYPLWLVPYRAPRVYPWIAPSHGAITDNEPAFVDFAVYGKRNDEPGVNYNALLEDKTRELGGIKTLISANCYDEATFWSVYDKDAYRAVKARTDPQNLFRDLYEKFKPRALKA